MKRQNSLILSIIVVMSTLMGCEKNQSMEAVQNVEWYKTHKEERLKMLEKCKTNPTELAHTPNCLNARQADALAPWGTGGGIDPKPLNIRWDDKKGLVVEE